MTAPRWEDVPEKARDRVVGALAGERDRLRPQAREPWRDTHDRVVARRAMLAFDAALARLAEPAQPSAAERWLAVPERARAAKLSELSDDVTIYSASPDCDTDGIPYADHAEASRALLALAREAERSGA